MAIENTTGSLESHKIETGPKLRVLFLLLLLSSCIPVPHRRTIFPPIKGLITTNNQPLIAAKVLQSFTYNDRECNETKIEVLTNENGEFELPERRETFLFISMGDDYHHTHICTEHQGVKKWLFQVTTAHESSGNTLELICRYDIAINGEQESGEKERLPFSRCKSKELPGNSR